MLYITEEKTGSRALWSLPLR